VLYIDDLVEPRAKQILFAGLPPLPWPHRSPPPISSKGRESRLEIRGNPRKRICKKIDTQTPISGKSNPTKSPDVPYRSGASEYFTVDEIRATK
jgi:hypothetical protein